MLFENTTLLLLWIACTYFIVQIMFGIQDAFQEVNKDLTAKLHKRLNDIVHRVRVEKDKDTYYWFDSDDDRFLGQGSSDEEIINALKARFPDHIFYLPTNHFIGKHTDWKPKISSIDLTKLNEKS